jgi:peroxiredoxin
MRHFQRFLVAILCTIGFTTAALSDIASTVIGKPAPEFTGTDSHGTKHSLNAYRGKTVVLEWTNRDCPFVGKHYNSGNMQKLQRQAKDDDVVWISVVSSAPGTQGHVSPDEANAISKNDKAAQAAKILDPSGKIGRLYGAKTTPHMYVIDPKGRLAYMGAIDSKSGWDEAEIAGAKNYVTAALKAVRAGKAPDPSSTRAYGCSVKYN